MRHPTQYVTLEVDTHWESSTTVVDDQ